ncbi:MAG: NAD(P)/FAD-dependent oxidoreductase [Acutalibacteraceae bacterium]
MYEILIVGGGPAGLTAAIYAARAGKHVAVLERGSTGGQIISAPLVENYPGIPSVSGTELARQMTEQACTFGAEIVYTEAVGLEKTPAGFRVLCMDGVREAKAVILATGAAHRSLGLAARRCADRLRRISTALSATARFMRDWTLRSWAAEIRQFRMHCSWQTPAAASR